MNITDLSVGDSGVIKKFSFDLPDKNIYKLMELGFIPGETISINKIAPLGTPIEINIMDSNICIRKQDASLISIEIL